MDSPCFPGVLRTVNRRRSAFLVLTGARNLLKVKLRCCALARFLTNVSRMITTTSLLPHFGHANIHRVDMIAAVDSIPASGTGRARIGMVFGLESEFCHFEVVSTGLG